MSDTNLSALVLHAIGERLFPDGGVVVLNGELIHGGSVIATAEEMVVNTISACVTLTVGDPRNWRPACIEAHAAALEYEQQTGQRVYVRYESNPS